LINFSIAPNARIKFVNRNQLMLRSCDVEKLVDDDHPVRAIWEFVGRMDLQRFYSSVGSIEGQAGRAAWDPKLLICLWVYAYSQGIASAREIERRFDFDPAFQWLAGLEVINHHTLSDFRVSGKATLDELFTQVLALLSVDGLITLEQVMHDGTKIRAYASADTFRREDRIREYLVAAEQQVKTLDEQAQEETSARRKKARERAARERKDKLEQAVKELEAIKKSKPSQESKEKTRVSITDPDARIMKTAEGGYSSSYNAQISTDAANGVIVGVAVTQSHADYKDLMPAIGVIEKNTGKLPKQVVVDGGFTSRENILAVATKGVELVGSLSDTSGQIEAQLAKRGVSEEFHPHHFIYDSETDTYTCPAGKLLTFRSKEATPGKVAFAYHAWSEDCSACPNKPSCCPKSKSGRTITRWTEDSQVAAFRKKMESEAGKSAYKKRGPIAEFTNAKLKCWTGLRQFCVRGIKKAELELKWASIALNIQLWRRLKWA
jgi:transposase